MSADAPGHKNDADQDNSLKPGWRVLGEHQLPMEADTAEIFSEWLGTVLQPLDLPADFTQKILQSTLDAVMHVETAPDGARVHLSLFMPAAPARKPQSWGFFRVETIEGAVENPSAARHEIKVYLYREGS